VNKYAITYGLGLGRAEIWTVWRLVSPEYRMALPFWDPKFYWDPPAICHSQEAAEAALRLLEL
jgi:hypothetical protein